MSFADGSDIELAGFRLMLARDQAGHYVHQYGSLFTNRTDISGSPGDQNLRPEIMMWSYTDWSGGEGSKFYDTARPNVYYKGHANPRNPGELNARPARSSGTVTANATPDKLMFSAAAGKLFMAAGCDPQAGGTHQFWHSTDGTNWTTEDTGFNAGDVLTAMCSDGTYLYLAKFDSPNHQIRRISGDDYSTIDFAAANAGNPWLGLAFLPMPAAGYVFAWNGRVLVQYDTTDPGLPGSPTTGSIVYVTAVDVVPPGAHGDIISAGNHVVFFYSQQGHSSLLKYGLGAQGGAMPMWDVPNGFVIKQITYQLGNVICLGDYAGKLAMFAISVITGSENFLGYIRPQTSQGAADISSSFGAESLVLNTDGVVYVYNIASDTVSELDDLSDSKTFAASTSYKDQRIAAGYNGTTVTTYSWNQDDGTLSTTAGISLETPAWDLDLPFTDKVLYGFHINSTDLSGSDTVTIGYDVNELGTYTDLPTLTSGKSNISFLAGPTAFRQIRWRITTEGAAKVFAVAAEIAVLASTETWDMVIDLRPDSVNRSTAQTIRPDIVRAELLHLKEQRASCEFLDGVPFMARTDTAWDGSAFNDGTSNDVPHSGYRESLVVIEDVQDVADEGVMDSPRGYGTMRIRLRKVTVT